MPTVVASGFGSDGGGLFALEPGDTRRIDALETVGLAVDASGTRLLRALVGYSDGSAPAHVLLYDAYGLHWYRRMAGTTDPHGLVWTRDDEFALVSTGTNAVHWYDADGIERRSQVFADAVDAWHLNCPALGHDGELVVTAFGTSDEEQGWRPALRAREATGLLLNVAGGAARFGGLLGPHDPLALPDDTWLICNSARQELVQLGPDGAVLREVDLGGWTRGLLLGADGDVYVGLSSRRHEGEAEGAQVVRLDLGAFTELDRWRVPCDEVFSLVALDDALLAGVQTGFGRLPGFAAG